MSMLASKLPEMVTHSSILVWEILQTEEHGGLQSIGLKRVEHDWSNFICLHAKINMSFPGGSDGKEFTCNAGDLGLDSWVRKTPATHFIILAWRIPWKEEPGRLQSMGLQRVGYNWVTNTFHEKYTERVGWINQKKRTQFTYKLWFKIVISETYWS